MSHIPTYGLLRAALEMSRAKYAKIVSILLAQFLAVDRFTAKLILVIRFINVLIAGARFGPYS